MDSLVATDPYSTLRWEVGARDARTPNPVRRLPLKPADGAPDMAFHRIPPRSIV
jgi:hypothetical protein